jgi:hypothetical protein
MHTNTQTYKHVNPELNATNIFECTFRLTNLIIGNEK